MATLYGGNKNLNNTAIIDAGVSCNSATSTTLVTTSADTIRVIMTNSGNQDAFIKLQAASVDNLKKGFILYKNSTADILLSPNMYTGEISAITKANITKIYTTVF